MIDDKLSMKDGTWWWMIDDQLSMIDDRWSIIEDRWKTIDDQW